MKISVKKFTAIVVELDKAKRRVAQLEKLAEHHKNSIDYYIKESYDLQDKVDELEDQKG